jgi:uncharacterized protein YydD (DUF2326 family)
VQESLDILNYKQALSLMWKHSLSNTVFFAIFSLENLAVNSILLERERERERERETDNIQNIFLIKKILFLLLRKIQRSTFLFIKYQSPVFR